MTIFIAHLLINFIVIGGTSIYSEKSSDGTVRTSIFCIVLFSIIITFFTGFIFLIPMGFNTYFFWQIFLGVILGFFSVQDWDDIEIGKLFSVMGILILLYIISSSILFHSSSIGNRINEVEIIDDVSAIDEYYLNSIKGEVRHIPKSTAIKIAGKALSKSTKKDMNLSSALEVLDDYATVQPVNGKDYWIIPLGFKGMFTQDNYGGIDAYVRVDAFDPNAIPKLITENSQGEKFSMEYTLGGYFSKNIKRVFMSKNASAVVNQYKFMVDDQWNPYVIIYEVEPDVGLGSYINKSVHIYDFRTKEFTEYTREDELPEWFTIFYNLSISADTIDDWGYYRKGYLQTWGSTFASGITSHSDHKDMVLTKTKDGRAWFSGMSSTSSSDNSVTHYAFMDVKTGKLTLIKAEGIDEAGAIDAVQSALGKDSDNWTAKMPILYLNETMKDRIWILLVVGDNSQLVERIAIVNSIDVKKVVVEKNLSEALRAYSRLGGNKGTITHAEDTETFDGYIESVNLVNINGSIIAYILVEESSDILECQTSKNPACLVMSIKQHVIIEGYEFNDNQIRVENVIKGGNKR